LIGIDLHARRFGKRPFLVVDSLALVATDPLLTLTRRRVSG
jgi:hypothetical protein